METGVSPGSFEPHEGIRHRIRIFEAKSAKVVNSETTQIGERAIGPLVQDSALAPVSVDVSACGGDGGRYAVGSRMDVDAGGVDRAEDRLGSGDFRRGAVSHHQKAVGF